MIKIFTAMTAVALGASPAFAFQGASLPAIATMLSVGAGPAADVGNGAFQDPFARAAKSAVHAQLELQGGVKLELKDETLSAVHPQAAAALAALKEEYKAAQKKLTASDNQFRPTEKIHEVSDILERAGAGSWLTLTDGKKDYFVFGAKNEDGETTYPMSDITGAQRRVIGGHLWVNLPGETPGSSTLLRLNPDKNDLVKAQFDFKGGELVGEAKIGSLSDLDALPKELGAEAVQTALRGKKINPEQEDSPTYGAAIEGWLSGEGNSVSFSRSKTGDSVFMLQGQSTYRLTVGKDASIALDAVGN